jgi:tetratricopeptide (TPR) repeat protein
MTAAKALQGRGDLAGAEAAYGRVLALEPENAEALNNLGNVLRALKRPEEAVNRLQQALKAKPEHPAILTNLGLALRDLRRFEEAAECQRRAVVVDPGLAQAHNNLGLSLRELGRFTDAEASYRTALALRPDFAEALNNLGNLLRIRELPEEAVSAYRRAVEIKPDYADAHYNLYKALHDQERPTEGEPHFRKGVQLDPLHPEAHLDRGRALQVMGRLDEAVRAFAKAIARNPASIGAHQNLVRLLTEAPDPEEMAILEDLASREYSLSQKDRISLHFTLAKAYELQERYDRSFRSLLKANRLKRRRIVYDGAVQQDYIARHKRVFSRELMTAGSGKGDPSALPIFIVGFPRSGTTLTEQILASHPLVHGAGELSFMNELLPDLAVEESPGLEFPESMAVASDGKLRRLGQTYVARLSALAPNAERITDKMPDNYVLLGLIRLILPQAKLIHVRRNPLDTCFSCFETNFDQGQYYAWDLGELGRHYRMYREVMDHWKSVLPAGSLLELDYEDLIGDLEGQARRILDYCGLAWDDRCLSFHETERPVKTASLAQVRRPLYRSSVGRWRPYERHLRLLMEGLGPAASSYE